MSPYEQRLYGKTIDRLRRAGCRNQEEQIVYLAEEIERYRAKIEHLQTTRGAEITGPALRFYATAYTSPSTHRPETEKTYRAQTEIAQHLLYLMQAAGCISYESRPDNHVPDCTEHTGTIFVVMPKKEGQHGGV